MVIQGLRRYGRIHNFVRTFATISHPQLVLTFAPKLISTSFTKHTAHTFKKPMFAFLSELPNAYWKHVNVQNLY